MTSEITNGSPPNPEVSTPSKHVLRAPFLGPAARAFVGVSAMTIAMLAAGAGIGVYWCGSLASTIAFLRGDSLIPDTYLKSFGSAPVESEAKVRFHLWNRSGRVVRILGAKTSCTCLVTSELPRDVPSSTWTELDVTIRTGKKPEIVSQGLQLMTDDRLSAPPLLMIIGKVEAEAEASILETP